MVKLIGLLFAAATLLGAAPDPKSQAKKQPCPKPVCEAPCVKDAPADVMCYLPKPGKPTTMSFACCCCGGGSGTSFKKLK